MLLSVSSWLIQDENLQLIYFFLFYIDNINSKRKHPAYEKNIFNTI